MSNVNQNPIAEAMDLGIDAADTKWHVQIAWEQGPFTCKWGTVSMLSTEEAAERELAALLDSGMYTGHDQRIIELVA